MQMIPLLLLYELVNQEHFGATLSSPAIQPQRWLLIDFPFQAWAASEAEKHKSVQEIPHKVKFW